ncbi:hypothetical protein AB0952_14820 [Streptomyces caniferus]|uniref:hypothetical protein n=1 Tax=Streptomyces caniferus TaxID=285557 RepID=UPI00345469EA
MDGRPPGRTGAPRGTTLVPDPDSDREGLHHWLTLRLDHLINVMTGLTGWVDTAHVESLLDASAPSLWRLTTGSSLRLVTGPERDPALQWYAADLAFLGGRGLGIRVLLDDAPDEPLSTRLLTLIDRPVCLPRDSTSSWTPARPRTAMTPARGLSPPSTCSPPSFLGARSCSRPGPSPELPGTSTPSPPKCSDASSACLGERWLHACAYGDGRDGSGNAETWIRVGHTQHMNFIVQQLARTA